MIHKFISFNGEILTGAHANLPVVSGAALYGRGVFTTCAIYNGKPFLWTLHRQRLTNDAQQLSLNLRGISLERVYEGLSELIKVNKVERGRARVTLFDLSNNGLWQFENSMKAAVLITTADLPETPENSLQLTLSRYKVNRFSPLAGIKSCNYLENLFAFDEAVKKGFDEALRQNHDGDLVSACFANVFWVKRGKIFTPQSWLGGIKGTTRQLVFKLAGECGLEIEEIDRGFFDDKTDEVFLASSGLGICAAKSYEHLDKQYFDVSGDSVFSKLHEAFQEYINK